MHLRINVATPAYSQRTSHARGGSFVRCPGMCVQAWRQLQLFVHQSTCGTGLALSERLTVLVCPNSSSFSVVWSPWPWSFHEDTAARSPPRPTVHLLRSILDLPSARWDVGWSCPTQPSRATPSAHATPLHFVRIVYPLSRLFMSINLSVYHLPRSLHSSVNALLSSSAPSARRTEAFCLCVCKSVCTCMCVCVCMHVCVCVSGVSAHVYPGPRLLGLGQLQPCWWQLSQCQTNP